MKQLTLLFLRRENEILLAMKKRGFGAEKWNGVGGKLDRKETVEQALERECFEEINVKPKKYQKVAEIVFHKQQDGKQISMLIHAFIAWEWEGEPAESEEMAPKWLRTNDIPYGQMWPGDKFWLPRVLAGQKLKCEFKLDENERIISQEVKEVKDFTKKFAAFDIDGTLVRWQLYHALVGKLAKAGAISNSTGQEIKAARARWKRRENPESFHAYEMTLINGYEAAIRNIDPAVFDRLVSEVIEEYKDQIYTYTRDLIKELKSAGYFLVAVSGSHKEMIELLAEYYGFDDYVGTEYHRSENRFSGKSFIASIDKASILNRLIAKHNLDLTDSIAIGDSRGDISMLEIVEKPIAFNPDRALYAKALSQGWKIVLERKNVIYELEVTNGTYALRA